MCLLESLLQDKLWILNMECPFYLNIHEFLMDEEFEKPDADRKQSEAEGVDE